MKTCIIAGQGDLPKHLAKENGDYLIICINGLSKLSNFKNKSFNIDLLNFEKLLNILKKYQIKNLVFAGKFNRPKISKVKISEDVFKLTNQIRYLGDDQLLNTVKSYFESKGFTIISPGLLIRHSFKKNEIANNKKLSNNKKMEYLKNSASQGKKILNLISKFDIGQSVVVRGRHVIGVEGLEGTNELIKRCGILYKNFLKDNNSYGPVLVKLPKLNQTLDLDIPVIGIKTFDLANKYNFFGIVTSVSNVLIMDEKKIRNFCDQENFNFYSMGD